MNYLKQYIKLVKKSLTRDKSELEGVYTEKHHIFPKSIFGDNDTLVIFTYKEHLIAHHLLYKICLKRYGNDHNRTIKMAHALSFLTNTALGKSLEATKIASFIKKTKKIKLLHSEETRKIISEARKGENHPMYGKTHTPETRQKQSKSHMGKKFSLDTRKKQSMSHIDHTLRNWINIETGEIELEITTYDLISYYDLNYSNIHGVMNGLIPHHRGWILLV